MSQSQRVILAVFGLVAMQALHANQITNGDFSGGTGGTWLPGSATGGGNAVPTGWLGYATANKALRVPSDNVVYNAGNQPAGSYIQQTVSGLDPAKWYVAEWDHQDGPGNWPQRAVSTLELWDGPTAAGAPNVADRAVRYPTNNIQEVFRVPSGAATLRFGDAGSNSNSNDTQIDNVSLVLANGLLNVAPSLGTASSLSHHGSFGVDPQQAVDGSSNFSDGRTNFHSAGSANEWWRLVFDEPVWLTRIEVQARSGYNNRNGDFFDLISPEGDLIQSYSITDGALWSADGFRYEVGQLIVRNSSTNTAALNLAEVRAFAEFVDGVMVVPEPGSGLLLGLGMLGMAVVLRRRI